MYALVQNSNNDEKIKGGWRKKVTHTCISAVGSDTDLAVPMASAHSLKVK